MPAKLIRLFASIIALSAVALFAIAANRAPEPQKNEASKRILIVVTSASQMTSGKPTGLWLEEFTVPYEKFRQEGFQITVASPKGGSTPIDPRSNPTPEQTQAWATGIQALKTTVPLNSVESKGFDAIYMPGGHGAMFDFPNNPDLAKLISSFAKEEKVVAAVCHGPAAFVGVSGADGQPLIKGRRIAAFTDAEEVAVNLTSDVPFLLQSKLQSLGAKVETGANFSPKAVRDKNLITGQNPASSAPVADLIITALTEK